MTKNLRQQYAKCVCIEDDVKIGKVLDRLLREQNLSYRNLALELGIPKSTLFNYAQNCLPRSGLHIKKLCQRFNITIEELLFDQHTKNTALKRGQIIKGTFTVLEIDEP